MPSVPRFEGDRKVDLAIVGGGYTGLSCAYYAKLFRPDWTVVVLESHKLASSASSRNSGAVYANQVGISDPEMPERGLNRLRQFMETEEFDCDFGPASTLMLLTSKGAAENAKSDLTSRVDITRRKWLAVVIEPDQLARRKRRRQRAQRLVEDPGVIAFDRLPQIFGQADARTMRC